MVFCTRYIYFEYQVMYLSLSNVLASLQKYVNKIFVNKLDIFVIVYFDNSLVYIKNSSQLYVDVI